MREFIDQRDGVAYQFELLTEGTTKNIWHSPDTDFVVIENTEHPDIDDRSEAMDIGRHEWFATQVSNNCFRYLHARDVPNHFLWPNTEEGQGNTFAARRLDMLPFELVVRFQPYGSYLVRHPEVDHTEAFPEPVIEIFEKNRREGDPELVINRERETVSRYRHNQPRSAESLIDERPLRALGHLTLDHWDAATALVTSASLALQKAWELGNVTLADIKFECGINSQNQVMIGDTIGFDSWRLWRGSDPADPLDAQYFGELDRRELIEARKAILLETMQWVRGGGGGNTGNWNMPGGGGSTDNAPEPGGGGGGSTGNAPRHEDDPGNRELGGGGGGSTGSGREDEAHGDK